MPALKVLKHFQMGDAQHISVIPHRLGSITQQAPVSMVRDTEIMLGLLVLYGDFSGTYNPLTLFS